jgi:thiol-disulfide isomerase/thioredoxin
MGQSLRTAFAAAILSLSAPSLADVSAPRVGDIQLTQPLPLPYDEKADANQAVSQALERARQSGKRVLVDLGGNWCGDCRVFAGILTVPKVHDFVAGHFEVVIVDVGRFTRNLDIPARFGVEKLYAAPTILIVSPTGTLLNGDDIVALQDARSMTPQAVVDWLAHWAA